MTAAALNRPAHPAMHRPGTAYWQALRDACAQSATNGRYASAAALEWARLAPVARMALVLLAGIDGDTSGLSDGDWQQFTPPEREAIQQAARALFRQLEPARALRLPGAR